MLDWLVPAALATIGVTALLTWVLWRINAAPARRRAGHTQGVVYDGLSAPDGADGGGD